MIRDVSDVFKKEPFIYKVNGILYALGQGVCSCAGQADSKYKKYELAIKEENKIEIADVRNKLHSLAKAYIGMNTVDKDEFLNSLSCDEKENLKKQIEKYVEIINY